MSERRPAPRKRDRDVLDALGEMIEGRLKRGREKLGALIAEVRREGSAGDAEEFLGYLKAFLADPGVAAIAPSSRYLVARTLKALSLENAKVVVEYGAARGVLTRRLLRDLAPDARLVAVEFNREFYEHFSSRLRDPRLIPVHGDVTRIDEILAGLGIARADRVVSGIPFSFLSEAGRRELLAKTAALLTPGGRFVATYQITGHLIPLLKDYFGSVDIQYEVRNIPPCFVFTGTKTPR
ncbi:MAG: methyltransferase domain-containing protein [Elusimicrobia bacterium]|nr:methyltransferase domain-containing protein [Elusimicrobiota bacterium]